MNLFKTIIFLLSVYCLGTISFGEFSPVKPGFVWQFPRDHGSHPTFKTEWWYYTGHLRTEDDHTYGFELTFFRNAQKELSFSNEWADSHIYMAHFAITDDSKKQFFYDSRLTRSAYNMAGASTEKLDVFNGDWKVYAQDKNIIIEASLSGVDLNLKLDANSSLVLQGESGFSKKSSEGSFASYYYSMPRLEGIGELTLDSQKKKVSQASVWFDHEFFSHELLTPSQGFGGKTIEGWDWFAIQLDSGDSLMVCQVRHHIAEDNYYFGMYMPLKGEPESLSRKDFLIVAQDTWKSSKTSIEYPHIWDIKIPRLGIDVQVRPTVKQQELSFGQNNALNYWEGRSMVSGSHAGQAYVELAGYQSP